MDQKGEPMICYRCGAELPDYSKFCGKCGAQQQVVRDAQSGAQNTVHEQTDQGDIRMNQQNIDQSVHQMENREAQREIYKDPPKPPIPPEPDRASKRPKKNTLIALLCAAVVLFIGAAVVLVSQYQTMKKRNSVCTEK